MKHYDVYEFDAKIIMATGKSEKEAMRELNRGSYVMGLQDFIDDYRATHAEECAEEAEYTEHVIAAVTETAEHIKNFSDGYFEVADEFNTVVNFDGKQYVIHWAL